ncbi:MAG: hypothetical protein V1838_00325 [Patescibacteria group bacterium]
MAKKPASKEKSQKIGKTSTSTQQFLDILEIKDKTVVLKDGNMRAVLLVASINFALKSEDEQTAVIQGYTQFLNSLDFTVQIVVQSRKLNIDEYIERIKERAKQQTNELLKMQTVEYVNYISELVEIADLMSKRFYVVVPYSPKSDKPKKFFSRLFEAFSPSTVIHLKQKQFDEYREELFKRVQYVIEGLGSSGLQSAVLDTQSLIALYYNTYNMESYEQQELTTADKLVLEEE